ncbi:hypothetical protein NXS19_012782 [Fusarium pseudograminearum]|nr:hypothetical protein NXS19_012782 [Fusarium pseudograminearum]
MNIGGAISADGIRPIATIKMITIYFLLTFTTCILALAPTSSQSSQANPSHACPTTTSHRFMSLLTLSKHLTCRE